MVEIFNDFTTTLAIVGVVLAAGIFFEKQLIALEDKFDAWTAKKKAQRKGGRHHDRNKGIRRHAQAADRALR